MTGDLCPKIDNECSTCSVIARTAMADGMVVLRPDLKPSSIAIVVENSNIDAPLEEDAPLNDLRCDERQVRALKIGHEMAKAYSVRTE